MIPIIYYNQEHGIVVVKTETDYEDFYAPDFIEAWKGLNARGFEISGFTEVDLGPELGLALQATDVEVVEPFEGNP